MSKQERFRLGDLLGSGPHCDFLSLEEVEALGEGRLASARMRAFEQHAAGCPSCERLVEDLELFNDLTSRGTAIASEHRSFSSTDKRVRRRLGLTRKPFTHRVLPWLLPAVAAAMLLMVFLLPRIADGAMLIEKIEPVELVAPPSVRGATLRETWRTIEQAWREQDMRAAAAALEAATRQAPDDESLLFYLGYARLRQADAEAALEALQRADALAGATPSEHVRWFLAAALERTGETEAACNTLRSVARIEGARATEAARITATACPSNTP